MLTILQYLAWLREVRSDCQQWYRRWAYAKPISIRGDPGKRKVKKSGLGKIKLMEI